MLQMLKDALKKAQDNWMKLSLAGLGAVTLSTFAVVYPPSAPFIFGSFALGTIGASLYAATTLLSSFFAKKAVVDAKTVAPADGAVAPLASSTVTMQAVLGANQVAPVVDPVEPVVEVPVIEVPVVAANDEVQENQFNAAFRPG